MYKNNPLPDIKEDLLPWEMWPGSRIEETLLFAEPMAIMCVEAKSFEIPNDSLMKCCPHTYALVQVMFRMAMQLHSKEEPYACVCSLLEPSLVVEETVRGTVTCGRMFWLVYPERLADWFSYVVRDMLMVNNGYLDWNSLLMTDMQYDKLLRPPGDDDDNDDDAGARKKRKVDPAMARLQYAFTHFDCRLGIGDSKMKRGKTDSPIPTLKSLGDFDRFMEKYFCFEIPGMPKECLRPSVRESDTPEAWRVRTDLLTPAILFGSSRLARRRRELTEALRRIYADIGEGTLSLERLMEIADVVDLPLTIRTSLEQIDPRMIMTDHRRISFRHMVAWKLDSYMFEPEYFLRRLFPSHLTDSNSKNPKHLFYAMRDDAESVDEDKLSSIARLYMTNENRGDCTVESRGQFGEKYTAKNPAIVRLRKTFKHMNLSPKIYLDRELMKPFFDYYYLVHTTKSMEMSKVLLQSHDDNGDGEMKGSCLNGCRLESDGSAIPYVYVQRDDKRVVVYQYWINFLSLINNVAGVSNAMGELSYILLSGINQLRPHKSMSLHGILVGPPGTGKTSVLMAAKAVIGNAYSDDVTYRTAKATLVRNPSMYGNSKKVRFANEHVSPGNGKGDKNPLASESSQEAAIMKEELDSGCTRTERVEKIIDTNTGCTVHGVRTVINVCDSATFLAMNEKEICYSLDTRVVTFDVPPSEEVNVPKKIDGFEADMDRYKLREQYSRLRHLVMETSRFIELGMYPMRSNGDSWKCERMLMLTWNRLACVLAFFNIRHDLETDFRFRERVFDTTSLVSFVSGITKVYGCPAKFIHEANSRRMNENPCCGNSRIIDAHQKWLLEKDRKYLHDDVIAESQPDPADLLYAFSLIHPIVSTDLVILRTIADQLIDPSAEPVVRDGENYFQLTCRTEETLLASLERKTGVSRKRCKDILLGMQSGGKTTFRSIDDFGRKQFLLLCSVATEAYLASHDDRYRSISDTMLDRLHEGKVDGKHHVKIEVKEQYTQDIKFLNHLSVHSRHTYWNMNRFDPQSNVRYVKNGVCSEDGVHVALMNLDFYETRLRYLRKRTLYACRSGGCKDTGVVEVSFPSVQVADAVRILKCRSWDGSRDRLPNEPVATNEANTCKLVMPTSTERVYMVHLSVFLPRWKHTGIANLCLKILYADDNLCRKNRIRVVASNAEEEEKLNNAMALETIDLSHLVDSSSILQEPNGNIFQVNLLTLNSLEETCRHFKVKLGESLMKKVMEKTVFKNMTERKTIVYVDRGPKGVFQTIDIDQLAENSGGSLPEHTCKNPYRSRMLRNPTTEVVDRDRLKFGQKEPELLKAEPSHVQRRKAYIRSMSTGKELKLRQFFGNNVDRYFKELRKCEDLLMEHDKKYGYTPIVAELGESKKYPCTCARPQKK